MGEYFRIVNLDKKEYIDPHECEGGVKFWEVVVNPKMPQLLAYILNNYDGIWAGDRITIIGDYDQGFSGVDNATIYNLCINQNSPDFEEGFDSINKWRKENGYKPVNKSDLFKEVSRDIIKEFNDYTQTEDCKIEPRDYEAEEKGYRY
jgi:hypothetical protein